MPTTDLSFGPARFPPAASAFPQAVGGQGKFSAPAPAPQIFQSNAFPNTNTTQNQAWAPAQPFTPAAKALLLQDTQWVHEAQHRSA